MAQRQEMLDGGSGDHRSTRLRLASPGDAVDSVVADAPREPAAPAGTELGTATSPSARSPSARSPIPSPGRHRRRGLHRRHARHRRRRPSRPENGARHDHHQRQQGGRHALGGTRVARTQPLVRVQRMSPWKSTLLAVVSLVFVLGIALGVMVGAGHLIHLVDPKKHFDIFYTLHEGIVRWSLVAICILWLLPPHPWATRLIEVPDHEAAAEPEEEACTHGVVVRTPRTSHLGAGPASPARGRRGGRRMA